MVALWGLDSGLQLADNEECRDFDFALPATVDEPPPRRVFVLVSAAGWCYRFSWGLRRHDLRGGSRTLVAAGLWEAIIGWCDG